MRNTKCPFCSKGHLKESVDLIFHNGKSEAVHVRKCDRCGEGTMPIDEYERARKAVKPTLMERLRNLFKPDTEAVELFRGKIV